MKPEKLGQDETIRELLDFARSKGLDMPVSAAEIDEKTLAQFLDEVTAGQDMPPSLVQAMDSVLAAIEAHDGEDR